MLLLGSIAHAQTDDPVLMTINGELVTRSEFEYSYNKNNSDGVIDKKTVSEYVDLFVNYKLKVAAAYDAKIDTLKSFKKEFLTYRDQQIRPSFVADKDIEAEAHKVYDDTKARIGEKGLIQPSHILIYLEQKATDAQKAAAQQKADSLYNVLKGGADFKELAKKYSQDPGSARNGGQLPWLTPGQTLPEFDAAAYALQPGEMSKPVLSSVGYHIIHMDARKQLEPYDTLRNSIMSFLEQRNVRDKVASDSIQRIVDASNGTLKAEDVLDARTEELTATDSDLKNLIREYHDGLMLYEISNQNVWKKASEDEAGLAAMFKKNKKKYNWDEPRYKGMVYHVKNADDVKAVKDCVKGLAFDKWADKLRTTFNNDSVIRIRVEKGLFKKGDNAVIDKMVFGKDTIAKPVKDYPIDAVYGKVLKKGPEDYQDVRGLVTADYQDFLEKQWVSELRKKYTVVVNKEVLDTVNKH